MHHAEEETFPYYGMDMNTSVVMGPDHRNDQWHSLMTLLCGIHAVGAYLRFELFLLLAEVQHCV